MAPYTYFYSLHARQAVSKPQLLHKDHLPYKSQSDLPSQEGVRVFDNCANVVWMLRKEKSRLKFRSNFCVRRCGFVPYGRYGTVR